MSKKKRAKANKAPQTPPPLTPEQEQEQADIKKAKENLSKHSAFLFWFTAVALVVIFGGRWLYAITEGYYGSFIQRDSSVSSAVSNMRGLDLTDEEEEYLLPIQQEWDYFVGSHLRDDVTVTAQDGIQLHGYLYNENSDVTVVVVPRYDQDSEDDFLAGTWLNEYTGCNILLTDPRATGESEGDVFGFGALEYQDLAVWLDWVNETLGEQTFILWGEGVGANTILFAETYGALEGKDVACIVAESPFASLHQLATRQIWKWYTVPAVPFLYSIEWKLNNSHVGYTVQDTNLEQALSNGTEEIPVLFLYSEEDTYILPEWTELVIEAYEGQKEAISGTGNHGTVYGEQQEAIQQQLMQWVLN